jgi:hypothetical protein
MGSSRGTATGGKHLTMVGYSGNVWILNMRTAQYEQCSFGATTAGILSPLSKPTGQG